MGKESDGIDSLGGLSSGQHIDTENRKKYLRRNGEITSVSREWRSAFSKMKMKMKTSLGLLGEEKVRECYHCEEQQDSRAKWESKRNRR